MALNLIAPPTLTYIAPDRTFALKTEITTKEDIKDLIAYYSDNETTQEIALAIAKAESNFYYKAQNPNSTAKGIFQVLDGTAHEQCGEEADMLNADDNIKCGVKMIENGDYWRWSESQPIWFKDIATSTRYMIVEKCNCGVFARKYLDFPKVNHVEELQPNHSPTINGGVLFTYGHIGVITNITDKGFNIIESNFHRCKISERFIGWQNNTIKGFIK